MVAQVTIRYTQIVQWQQIATTAPAPRPKVIRMKEPAPAVCPVCGKPRGFDISGCGHDVGNVRKCE